MPRRRTLQKPKAVISYLADQNTSFQVTSKVATEVIERVRKCFARANHKDANEQEARAASRMARKIMEQYQISQADIMIQEDAKERERRGGMSAVDIWPAKDGNKLSTPVWIRWFSGAVSNVFDCRYFSTRHRDRVEWTFYGIAMHTISAAIAFEAVHNQIQDWSERFTGISVRNSYRLGVAKGLLNLSKDEKSRAEDQVREAEAEMLAAKIKQEAAEDEERIARLRPEPIPMSLDPSSSHRDSCISVDLPDDKPEFHPYGFIAPYEFNDGGPIGVDSMLLGDYSMPTDDEDYASSGLCGPNEIKPDFIEDNVHASIEADIQADFDTELQKYVVPNRPDDEMPSPSTIKGDQSPIDESPGDNSDPDKADPETARWASMRQLATYREMSKDIEDNVLKTNNIKLRKGRKHKASVKNKVAYQEGKEDSKKIEIRAARIEAPSPHSSDDMDTSQ
ncbi:MAG: hypothetical protein Q9198_002913 [Flavoplaca austrocitrina]